MLEFVISPLLHEKEDIMNAKRQAARFVRNVSVDTEGKVSALDHLFAVLGPKFAARNGGFTHQLKLGNRRGDDAPIVLVAWVD